MKDVKEVIGDIDKIEGIKVTSTYSFFEIFSRCPNKIALDIPETTIIKDNEVRDWLLTRKTEPKRVIRKSEDKMNLRHMFYKFTGVKMEDHSIIELRENFPRDFCAMATFNSGEKFLVKRDELKYICENMADKVKRVQAIVKENPLRQYSNPHNISTESLYCFASRENPYAPFTYKYFKRSLHYEKTLTIKLNSVLETLLEQMLPTSEKTQPLLNKTILLTRKYSSEHVEELYYKSFDSTSNQNLEKSSRKLTDFLESEFHVRVKSFMVRFMTDYAGRPILLGASDLTLFPLTTDLGFSRDTVEEINSYSPVLFTDLLEHLEYPYKPAEPPGKKVELPKETIQVFSNKLFRSLITKACVGGFCDYHIILQNSLFDDDEKKAYEIPHKSKIYGTLQKKDLPFQIPYSLITNVHAQRDLIIQLLQKHKIHPPAFGSLNHSGTADATPKKEDYSFKSPRLQPNTKRSYDKEYSMAHICPKCLQIYSLLSRELEKILYSPQKKSSLATKKKWIHTEVKVKQYIKGSQTLYPLPKSNPADKLTLKDADTLHHNVGLFIQSKKGLKPTLTTDTPREPLPNIIQASQRASPELGVPQIVLPRISVSVSIPPKIVVHNDEISNASPALSALSTSRLHQQTLPDTLKLSSLDSPRKVSLTADHLRRLSMGIVATREDVSVKEKTILPGFPTRELSENASRVQIKRSVDLNKNEVFLNFVKQSGCTVNNIESVPASPGKQGPGTKILPNDLLNVRFGREKKDARSINSSGNLALSRSRSISVEQRNERKQKLINEVTKHLEKSNKTGSIAQDLYMLKKNLFEDKKTDIGIPLSVYHYKHFCARRIPVYKLTINKYPLDSASKLSKILTNHDIVDYSTYKNIGGFPNIPIDQSFFTDMFGYLHQQNVAIPFMVLDSLTMVAEEPLKIVVVCHDFFDNFMEYIEVYQTIIKSRKNTRVILFNYPGQALTIFPNNYVSTNENCSEVLDGLLCRLEKSGVFSIEKDEFNFIGYGYGGNILTCFLCSTENCIPSYKNLLLVNSFAYADDLLTKTLQEMIEIFEEAPENLPQLPYEFYLLLAKSGAYNYDIKEYMSLNPISKAGRLKICTGCLNSFNLRKKIGDLQINKSIIHSLNNCFIPVGHSDLLANNEDERYGNKKNGMVEIYFKKRLDYVNGGHAVLQENLEEFLPKLTKFISDGMI